jgi:hypothetical protein
MIKERLTQGGRIGPLDFHPHYHWQRPPPGAEPLPFNPPILDLETRQRRQTEEIEHQAQRRAHIAVRRAQTGRILSQFEQLSTPLRHCSSYTKFGHDKSICRGCRSTGHTRANCPFLRRERKSVWNRQDGARQHQEQISQYHTQQPPLGFPYSSQQLHDSAPFGSQSLNFGTQVIQGHQNTLRFELETMSQGDWIL